MEFVPEPPEQFEAVAVAAPAARMKVAVIVASLGRPQNLAALLETIGDQTLLPSEVVLSVEQSSDLPDLGDMPFPIKKVFGARGMTAQRNRGMETLSPDTDIVVFYDDDFVPSRHALMGIATLFETRDDICGATGFCLKDGISGPGIAIEDAKALVQEHDAGAPATSFRIMREGHALYGCNMAYRFSAVRDQRFDEDLPLYSWLEDRDFSARVPGRIVWTDAFVGVHCGEKRGRERSGYRVGYSQVVNPAYLVRKGTAPTFWAVLRVLRNLVANHLRSLSPEPWIDRRGRMKGNWAGIRDLVLKRAHPTRIVDL